MAVQNVRRQSFAQAAFKRDADDASSGEGAGPDRPADAQAAGVRRGTGALGPSVTVAGSPRKPRRLDLDSIPMLDTKQSCNFSQADAQPSASRWQDILAQAQRAQPALLDGHGHDTSRAPHSPRVSCASQHITQHHAIARFLV
jgi:hypothetical protein